MSCPCLECPKFREWVDGAILAGVSFRCGLIEANRLARKTSDDEPGQWDREQLRVGQLTTDNGPRTTDERQ
jgi:hypothetical protein